jgi:hypothetical protein
MAQDFVSAFYHWFLTGVGVIRQLLPYILLAAVAASALWLAYDRLSPKSQESRAKKAKWLSSKALQVAALIFVLLLITGTLAEAHQMVSARRDTQAQAQASRHKEPQLSDVQQYAPRIGYEAEHTYTRTLTLPPQFVDRIGTEGIQVLSPYLSDPSAEGVEKLVDTFRKSGRDVVFTRELTRLDEVTIAADSADVNLKFDSHRTQSGQRYYQVGFDAVYQFRNPKDQPANMRFVCPLPMGGGTVEGFYFDVNGAHITEPDDHGLYSWKGEVPAHAALSVHAHYDMTGASGYSYLLGSESRRIGTFHLHTVGGGLIKFAKSGIYPSSVNGSSADWNLHDVLTAQSISLVFPNADVDAQLFDKTLSLLPLAAVLFAVSAFWLRPNRAIVGLAAFGLGLAAIPVIAAYLPPASATLIGAGAAAIVGGAALGKKSGWALSVLVGVLCLVFLSGEHGALAAWLACVAGMCVAAFTSRPKDVAPAS